MAATAILIAQQHAHQNYCRPSSQSRVSNINVLEHMNDDDGAHVGSTRSSLSSCHQRNYLFNLCRQLTSNKDGSLTAEQVRKLLVERLGLSEDCEKVQRILGERLGGVLRTDEDEEGGDLVTVDELLNILRIESIDFQVKSASREHLVKVLSRVTAKNDALMTLPINLAYIVVFLALVVGHLQISERQAMETSLESWIDGRDPKLQATRNVDDLDSFWDWLLGSSMGLEGIFQVSHDRNGLDCVYLANKNIFISDVLLGAEDSEGNREEVWLIHSDVGQSHLNATNRAMADYLLAAKAAAQSLKSPGVFYSEETRLIWVSFLTYNEEKLMYARNDVRVYLQETGFVDIRIKASAHSVRPYDTRNIPIAICDVMYCCMVLYVFFQEGKDMCAYLRMGCSEFLDYWGFWNAVDWMCIVFGLAAIGLWVTCMVLMTDPSLHGLYADGELTTDAMALDIDTVRSLMEQVSFLNVMVSVLHFIVALNTIAIVLRFFKAFQSNPRLKVVTDTFKHAWTDFVHFLIIFSMIFLPFAMIGHVLFGRDITQFRSLTNSVNTALQVMMGDFGWYSEVSETTFNIAGTLPSGMPVLILVAWYTAYMFLIVLVLLNMLLAIIIEHYTTVTASPSIKSSESLWKQVYYWFVFRKQTQRFIPITALIRALENDGDPAHPEEKVTVDSLMAAWPSMSQSQAEWLLRFVRKSIDQEEQQARELEDDKQTNDVYQLLEEHGEQLKDLSSSCKSMHKEAAESREQRQSPRGREDQEPEDKLDRQTLLKIASRLEDLIDNVAKLRRDQVGLARRVEEMARPREPDPPKAAASGEPPLNVAEISLTTLLESRDEDAAEGSKALDGRRPPEGEKDKAAEREKGRDPPEKDRGRSAPEREKGKEKKRQSGIGVKLKEKEKDKHRMMPAKPDRDRDKDRGRIAKE